MEYEQLVRNEVEQWKRKVTKKSGVLNRVTKNAQSKINNILPDKVRDMMTEAIKKMVQGVLYGSEFLTKSHDDDQLLSLQEKDQLVKKKLQTYKKIATVEGAGTGGGGVFLGLADFPLLLSIKMKFLFEVASIYGFDTKLLSERNFILYVFQLAFSSSEHRKQVLSIIEDWENNRPEVDWGTLQQEYRDYIDFVKMLQLVPGIGAVVGAYANYNLLDELGETAMNAYHIRLFTE
ncbi:EcsC family protein [Bacillus ginsengihumi]|uniref:EcsC family protein n=1 Tax=Heyndrickxia ginsengihumi TaxID=363870 RepID=A0A6M0P361_9BACI|nr:EcsC family protein [Heyndrickxia ginsengihumi]MBE6184696.1 EcsC family protein [Bacillus sp. (in: firmicutes)]NEY18883.1 EcsC family protein [Heyndrickxia ginsengihumi]